MSYALGKLPARAGAVKLKFADYATELPPIPAAFGHQALIPADGWGMLGNDTYGCCAWAGPAHETMIWNKAASRDVTFTTDNVLADYSAATGFNPDDPSSDRGTDMQQGAAYRQKVGIIDADGRRHKIGAYVALEPGNLEQLRAAAYIFGAVGIGIEVPSYFQDEFAAGKPWDVRRRAQIEGGHYVPVVGADEQFAYVVTWGRLQSMTWDAFSKFNDETIAYLSPDQLTDAGLTPEGFNNTQLAADLQAVTSS